MSRTFAIIGCSATKKEGIAPAGELYCSDLFNKKKQWCQAKGIPHYVLSSCYGLARRRAPGSPPNRKPGEGGESE